MKKNYKSCMLATFVGTAALLIGSSAFAAHPTGIPLRTADGTYISLLGTTADIAYSAKGTCGSCHDYNKIERHSFHAQLGANEHKGWNPWKNGNMNSIASKSKPWVQSTGHVGKW